MIKFADRPTDFYFKLNNTFDGSSELVYLSESDFHQNEDDTWFPKGAWMPNFDTRYPFELFDIAFCDKAGFFEEEIAFKSKDDLDLYIKMNNIDILDNNVFDCSIDIRTPNNLIEVTCVMYCYFAEL